MKKQLLKTFMVFAAGLFGSTNASADTSILREADGWSKITSFPSNVSDYYFVFVDNSQDLMLELRKGVENANNALYYMTSQNPLLNRSFLWTLEANSGNYAGMYSMRNVEFSSLLMQTEWGTAYKWDTNDQANPCEWTAVNMQYDSNNNYWTLENGKYPSTSTETYKGYLGPWKETNTNTNITSGQELAGNKSGVYIGHFQIYSISKADAATYYASLITNASKENPADVSYRINNREANLNEKDCWTTSGVYRNTGAETYDGNAGFFEPSEWSAASFTCTMSQTLTDLPEGIYQVKTTAQASTGCTLSLTATSGSNSSSATLTSKGDSGSSISSRGGWEWLNSGSVVVSNGTLTITVTSTASAEHNWGNVDGFRLLYLGNSIGKEELLSTLNSLLNSCKPYDDVTDNSEYTTYYNIYKNYSTSNSVEEIQAAITYLQTNYPTYQWANASIAHPVDVTEGIISGWECTSNDAWPGSGRSTETGTYYDGTSRTYFTQNVEPNAARSQNVTIRNKGAYLLRTVVRIVNNNSYAEIQVGDEKTRITENIGTAANTGIGYGWVYNDVYFVTTADNESKTIKINLSHYRADPNREADCGEMHLYYIGQNADFIKDGVHKYIGTFATAPTIELTDAEPVADIKGATFTSGSSALTFTNPNGLVFANAAAQVNSTTKNVVVNGTCSSLQLEKGHPFINPTEFTATAAKYAVAAEGELAGGRFATLMIPFNATTLPGTAYTLNNGVDLMGGTLKGTVASSIDANSPVLVTAAGDYTGSNVTIPVVAAGATYTNGQLVGTYSPMTAVEGSYVLQNHTSGEGVAFYLVGSSNKPTVNPFRAYIKPQGSNARALKVVFDDAQGISTTLNDNGQMTNDIVYDLQGRRVAQPTKGLYIVNGRKTVIK